MPRLTLPLDELKEYRAQAERAFVEVELRYTKLNSVGYKGDMKSGDELMIYMYLLKEMGDNDFQDDTYESLVSNHDVHRIVTRINQLRYDR